MTGRTDIKERGKHMIDRIGKKKKKKKGLGSSIHLQQVAPFSVAEPHRIPTIEELFQRLDTTHTGLGANVVSKRHEIYGPNELRVRTDVPNTCVYYVNLRTSLPYYSSLAVYSPC